ncbi:MAG: S46 family peptidase [Pirellulaceae bacterium]|nr:S46 family peptidase [Pirellulaceae bacterium]
MKAKCRLEGRQLERRQSHFTACLLVFLGSIAIYRTVVADEGMIPMSELGKLNLIERGIELTADELFNPNAVSLVDGVCRVNGCTGSFVSNQGLIITNHHCAYGAIQKASTTEHDYLLNGFKAVGLTDEIPAPDYTVRVTEDYRDVSEDVLSAIHPQMSFLDRTRAIEKRSKELEAAAERKHSGLRAEVAEMFAGKTYVLFLYTYLKDIRLSFAPPQSVGNFGGEHDNWMWPRHTGDFSFMRAYTAPDGSSATYAAENVPYQPKRFIQVAPQGVDENDTVFLLGYPGKTARHKTASFLTYEQNVRLPMIVDLYGWLIDVMTKAGNQERAVEIQHASRIRSLANVEKRYRGQLTGLRKANIVQTRTDQESQLKAFIDSDPARKGKYGQIFSELDAAYAEVSRETRYEILLDQLRTACRAAAFGFFIYDAAVERLKLDIDREANYMDRNWELSVRQLKTSMGDYHAPTDKIMLAGILERLQREEPALQNKVLNQLIDSPAQIAERSSQWIDQTRLGELAFVESCLTKSPDELTKLDDPILNRVIDLYPTYLKMRETEKEREGRFSHLYASLIEIKQQFLETSFIPDANATLRLTSGRVRGYSPEDAVTKTPITTLTGVIEKTTGVDPFITPLEVIAKYRAKEFGPFRHPKLGDVPVAILYDTDTTGGNSGSPVFNRRGELVGVNFDRCYEATINDFAWDPGYSRSIGVDIRYVLWITGIVYEAEDLLIEMGVTKQ